MVESPSPSPFLSSKLYEPLIPPLLAVIGGILFVSVLGFDAPLALALGGVSAILWFAAWRTKAPVASYAAGLAVMFWLAIASSAQQANRPKPFIDAEAREVVALAGCVDSLPQREADRLFFHFAAAPQARLRVSWYLKPEDKTPDIRYGQRLKIPLRLRAIHNSGNPGNFDAQAYFAHRDIFWSASVASRFPVETLAGDCGKGYQAAIFSARSFLLDRIHLIAQGDKYLDAMLGALLLGDNAKLEDSWTDNYRRTGTYHAIVISGIHITVLAGALFRLLRLCGLRPMPAYCLCAIMAVLYALICDLSAPVVRAAGGYLLFLVARHYHRRGRILNLLAAVAILYLLYDPAQLFEASFQLSFLAVLTLAALGIPLIDAITARWSRALYRLDERNFDNLEMHAATRRLELRLAVSTLSRIAKMDEKRLQQVASKVGFAAVWSLDLFLTSAIVLVGLCLPTVLFFHRLTFSSLTANLPVVVLLSIAVPVGFMAIAIGPLMGPILRALLYLSRDVVDWHLTWDTTERIPNPPLWLTIALPLTLIFTAWAARKVPRYAVLPALASLALFAYLAIHPYAGQPQLNAGLFEVTSVDIGQGDSIFLSAPNRHLAVLDGGGNRSPRFDTGESTLSPYLWSRQIGRLDTLIASHADQDHMGGLLAALDNFLPKELWVSTQVSGPLWDRLEAKAVTHHVAIRKLAAGDCPLLGDLPVEVLWPPRDEPMTKSNSTSLVLLIRHGDKRFLFTGDIDSVVEARLLDNPKLTKLDLLKIAHHGSKSSTSTDFLDRTQPAITLVSAGFANSFGHPHPLTLERLRHHHSLILRTDQLGQITILSDGKTLRADPYLYRDPPSLAWVPLTLAVE